MRPHRRRRSDAASPRRHRRDHVTFKFNFNFNTLTHRKPPASRPRSPFASAPRFHLFPVFLLPPAASGACGRGSRPSCPLAVFPGACVFRQSKSTQNRENAHRRSEGPATPQNAEVAPIIQSPSSQQIIRYKSPLSTALWPSNAGGLPNSLSLTARKPSGTA